MRRDVERPAARHELGAIVTFVSRHRDPVQPAYSFQHLQPLLTFGPAGGLAHAQVDHHPIAILHQHTLGIAEPGLLAGLPLSWTAQAQAVGIGYSAQVRSLPPRW